MLHAFLFAQISGCESRPNFGRRESAVQPWHPLAADTCLGALSSDLALMMKVRGRSSDSEECRDVGKKLEHCRCHMLGLVAHEAGTLRSEK